MNLPVCYHWSPATRRKDILRDGLKPYSRMSNGGFHNDDTGNEVVSFPYICLATEASRGWALSGGMPGFEGIEDWDLWEVRLADSDEVHISLEYGPSVKEIRVTNAIPPDRVRWIATRSPLSAEEIKKPTKTTRKGRSKAKAKAK